MVEYQIQHQVMRNKLIKHFSETTNTQLTSHDVFGNFQGLRLCQNGYELLINEFEYWSFPITNKIRPRKHVMLNKNMSTPYYITDKNIYLFSEVDAFSLQIVGDIDIWIDSIAL